MQATSKKVTALTVLTVTMISIGTVAYHYLEQFSWFDSFYFTIITLTTVGYGDFSPETFYGKLFTIAFVLIGIGIMVAFVTASAEYFMNRRMNIYDKKRKNK